MHLTQHYASGSRSEVLTEKLTRISTNDCENSLIRQSLLRKEPFPDTSLVPFKVSQPWVLGHLIIFNNLIKLHQNTKIVYLMCQKKNIFGIEPHTRIKEFMLAKPLPKLF